MRGRKKILDFKSLYRMLCEFNRHMVEKEISTFASSTAFFLFLSLIPILYLVCSLLPYANITEAFLRESIDAVLPGVVGMFVNSIVADLYRQSAGGISLAVLVMLWSAGKGMMALMRGLDAINEVGEDRRNYIYVRCIAALYTVLLILAVFLSVGVGGFGKYVFNLFLERIPGLGFIAALFERIQFIYAWGVLTLLFMLIYSYAPGRRQEFLMQMPGALFTAVIWNGFSIVFSAYLEHFGDFGIYGSLATVVIVLLWLYSVSYITMVGAHINRSLKLFFEALHQKQATDS